MDYFSEDYIRFEEDFQKYSAMDVSLTFLIDDILRTMAMNQKNYFKLNIEMPKMDGIIILLSYKGSVRNV